VNIMWILKYSILVSILLLNESWAFIGHPNALGLMGELSEKAECNIFLLWIIIQADSYISLLWNEHMRIGEDFMEKAVPGEECARSCSEHDRKVCHFKFQLEFYQVLGG
jgi:hypothetical protein